MRLLVFSKFYVVFFIFGGGLFAANRELIVPQDPKKPIGVGELLCVELPSGEPECGKVVSSGTDIVRIEVEESTPANESEAKPKKKNKSKPSPTPVPRPEPSPSPAPVSEPSPSPSPNPTPSPEPPPPAPSASALPNTCQQSFKELGIYTFESSIHKDKAYFGSFGLTVGTSFYNFFGRLEKEYDHDIDLGFQLLGAYAKVEQQSVKVFGSTISANYWIDKQREGLHITPALSFTYITKAVSNTGVSFSAFSIAPQTTVGWRFAFSKNMAFVPRGGFQYGFPVSGDQTEIDFSGLLPFVSVEFGWAF